MPQVLTHGLVASGGVFLRVERSQILGYVSQILAAGVDSLGDSAEAGTLCALIRADRCRARYGAQSAQVQTVAVGARGGCLAVRSQEHLLVGGVRRLLVDLLIFWSAPLTVEIPGAQTTFAIDSVTICSFTVLIW